MHLVKAFASASQAPSLESVAAFAVAAAGVSAGVELPPENNPVIPWPMACPIPTPAAVETMFESIPPPWETGAGGAAAGLGWPGVVVVG